MPEPDLFAVLPLHPRPDPGECLSGYVVRLAEANGGMRVGDLVRDLFPGWTLPHQAALLRWEYPIDDGGRLPVRAHLGDADLRGLTIAPWVAKFRAPPVIARPGALSPGSLLRGVVRPTLQVCPLCVRERRYVRLLWRLTPVRACLVHGCLLQEHCPQCAAPFAAIGPAQRLLRCPRCGADAAAAPVVAAPAADLAIQQRVQDDLRFLLDPTVRLGAVPRPAPAPEPGSPAGLIGVKFRYLRTQAGRSQAEIAGHVGIRTAAITSLERGAEPIALPVYLAYLDCLGLSWPEFAALVLPPAFVQQLHELPYRALRRCPTPGCPNHRLTHRPPPGAAVTVMADLPDRQIVRFRCAACHRTFSRRHDGRLVTKPRRPPPQPRESPLVRKSAAEIARLTELGRQGLPNRQIARQLGWGQTTVRLCWIALNREAEVHAAQARREAQAVEARRADRRAQVAAVLAALAESEKEVTISQVSRALGRDAGYVHTDPPLARYARELVQAHNARARERKRLTLAARLTRVLAEAPDGPEPLTIGRIARQLGISTSCLQEAYPELHARAREAVRADRTGQQEARRQRELAQIAAAAARLGAEGRRLTYESLRKAAGLKRYHRVRNAAIHAALSAWLDP